MRTRGVYEVIKRAHKEEKSAKVGFALGGEAEESADVTRECQVTEPMVRLVNLLMRDEGPDTAIEEVPSAEEDTLRPTADTVFVSADGSEVKAATEEEEAPMEQEAEKDDYVPFQRKEVEKVDSEDEEEMLLEV